MDFFFQYYSLEGQNQRNKRINQPSLYLMHFFFVTFVKVSLLAALIFFHVLFYFYSSMFQNFWCIYFDG